MLELDGFSCLPALHQLLNYDRFDKFAVVLELQMAKAHKDDDNNIILYCVKTDKFISETMFLK